jgi:hypothetical protein
MCNPSERPLVRCWSSLTVRLHDLEVGFVGLHRQCSCGNVPVHSVFKGMNTIAALLPYSCVEQIIGYGCREKICFLLRIPTIDKATNLLKPFNRIFTTLLVDLSKIKCGTSWHRMTSCIIGNRRSQEDKIEYDWVETTKKPNQNPNIVRLFLEVHRQIEDRVTYENLEIS